MSIITIFRRLGRMFVSCLTAENYSVIMAIIVILGLTMITTRGN
jgi:ABC-type dipeptide/oligopeptide/nickel transport system permease component